MQPSPARDVNIASTEALISPVGLVEELPLTPDVEAVVLEGQAADSGRRCEARIRASWLSRGRARYTTRRRGWSTRIG